jgi:hypothetical protein
MGKLLAICLVFAPAIALASEESNSMAEASFEGSSASSEASLAARVQVAYEVKRDAEGYLAGAEMTRSLRLKLEQLQSEHPDLETDDLVEHALDEADALIAEERATE